MRTKSPADVTDVQIRHLYNSHRDGTATDAIVRFDCRVALGERCVHDDMHPDGVRYPYADEQGGARARCAARIVREAA